jgi:peptidyl-prolyl cis-trans isomerase B (cyclophilin B)
MKRTSLMFLGVLSLLIVASCGMTNETATEPTDTPVVSETEQTNQLSTNTDTTMEGADVNAIYQAISTELETLGEDVYAKNFDKINGHLSTAGALAANIQEEEIRTSIFAQLDGIQTLMDGLAATAAKCSTDQLAAPQAGDQIATITTNKGVIKARLFTCDVPEMTKNFITHAQNGFYDGIIFHRVIADFMVQTGDPQGTGMGGYSYQGEGTKLNDEFSPNLKNLRGALSMANSGPNTNGSQFFIVQAEGGTPWLDLKHSVFGQVFEGMDVVDAIAAAETDGADKPVAEISMESVTISTY